MTHYSFDLLSRIFVANSGVDVVDEFAAELKVLGVAVFCGENVFFLGKGIDQ